MPTGRQIRAARTLLGWDQRTLAARAGVGVATVRRVEAAEDREPRTTTRVLGAIRDALRDAGIEFANERNGVGVRLRRGGQP